ncbi:hypothetical protein Tco_1168704 [Tanacetum coccineum]
MNDQDMFDVNDLVGKEVFVAKQGVPDSKKDDVAQVNTAVTTVSTASTIPVSAATITEDEITLAQALEELKSVKPKVTTATTATTQGILLQEPSESITTTITTIPSKDKGKAEFDEEERLAREKDEANVALIEEWNDIHAKIETEYELAQRLSKRAGDELEQENAKKQKVDDDQEAAKMKELMKIIPDEEEVAIDAIPLATKPSSIVDFKIVKEGKISYH